MSACSGDCKKCNGCDRNIVDDGEYSDWTMFTIGIAVITFVTGIWGTVLIWWLW